MAGWSKPSPHVVKVNCRGVFDRGMMRGSVGCVMRNFRGEWLGGVGGMIGLAVPVAAELWSIFYGLKLAWEKGYIKHVVIESECLEAVNQVNNPDPAFWFAEMVELITGLLNEAWDSCVVVHVPSSSNVAATTLAELNGCDGGVQEFGDVPGFMESLISEEKV